MNWHLGPSPFPLRDRPGVPYTDRSGARIYSEEDFHAPEDDGPNDDFASLDRVVRDALMLVGPTKFHGPN